MKYIKFIALAAAAFMFAACEEKTEGVTNVTLDQSAVQIEVGKTVTLTATVEPAGAAEVTWESSNTAVATVDGGVVTGVAEGTAIIAASADGKTASCIVTVVAEGSGDDNEDDNETPGDLHSSLQGSEYFVFQLGETASSKIASKIVADFRPDNNIKNLFIWDATYIAGTTQGLNFYGDPEGWVSLDVLSVGWSGFAYNVEDLELLNKLSAIMANPENYYFHIAIKSTDNASHLLFLDGTAGSGKICVGEAAFVDKGVTYQPVAGLTRDGSWNEIEVCMADLVAQGLSYGNSNTVALNVFGALSGGVAGTNLQFDAAFIYKK